MRSISRTVDVSINTVSQAPGGRGQGVRRLPRREGARRDGERVQCDEIWSFTYAKQKNVKAAKAAPEEAGDTWTWTALDADTKLIVSWLVGGRDAEYADAFMEIWPRGWPTGSSSPRTATRRTWRRLRAPSAATWTTPCS